MAELNPAKEGGQAEEITGMVCLESDLKDGEMREVEVGSHKVLLVRSEGGYSAVGNLCTHYGASLSKGSGEDKEGERDGLQSGWGFQHSADHWRRMREVEVGSHKVLLVRSEGGYSAVGNLCTHYGASLSKGRIAALNMLKKRVGINSVPFFWTMLMGKSFRYAGYGEGHTEVIMKGKVEEMKFLAFYIKYSTISSFYFNQPKHKYY
ncbi:UNVERIFIED_CONTAM: hypothetical protein FKN15_003674 [Acipenser sinensis]